MAKIICAGCGAAEGGAHFMWCTGERRIEERSPSARERAIAAADEVGPGASRRDFINVMEAAILADRSDRPIREKGQYEELDRLSRIGQANDDQILHTLVNQIRYGVDAQSAMVEALIVLSNDRRRMLQKLLKFATVNPFAPSQMSHEGPPRQPTSQ